MRPSDYAQRKAERTKRYQAQHGLKLVRCTACNGSGRYDHNASPKCGSCGGTGREREAEWQRKAREERLCVAA